MQPALFEAYGLTVVEAMTTGLTTFATNPEGPRRSICMGDAGSRWEVWGFIPPTRERTGSDQVIMQLPGVLLATMYFRPHQRVEVEGQS